MMKKLLPLQGLRWIHYRVAIQKMSQRITPEIERQADAVLDRWFAEYTPFEEML